MTELLSGWNLSIRSWNALFHGGIITVDDLRRTDQEHILRVVNIGKVSLAEIVKEAQAHGINIPRRCFPDSRPAGVSPQDYHPAPDPVAERIDRLEARVAELEAMLWGRVA